MTLNFAAIDDEGYVAYGTSPENAVNNYKIESNALPIESLLIYQLTNLKAKNVTVITSEPVKTAGT